MPLEEVRAMERRAASDPKKAIAEGRASLAAAEAAGNKVARLAALRLIALSHDALDDNPGLRDTARIGLALARELGDRPAQGRVHHPDGALALQRGPDARIDPRARLGDRARAGAQPRP
jgi:hypothetical protein